MSPAIVTVCHMVTELLTERMITFNLLSLYRVKYSAFSYQISGMVTRNQKQRAISQ